PGRRGDRPARRPSPGKTPLDAGPRPQGNTMNTTRAAWLFVTPALIILGLFFLLPVVAALVLSVTDYDLYALADIRNLRFVALQNYWSLLQRPLFWSALGHTVYFVVVGVPLSLIASLGAAMLLNSPLA